MNILNTINVHNYIYKLTLQTNVDRFNMFYELKEYCFRVNEQLALIAYPVNENNVITLRLIAGYDGEHGLYNDNHQMIDEPEWLLPLINKATNVINHEFNSCEE